MSTDLSAILGPIVIIPAAGSGSRMQSSKPKQYLEIGGKKILEITLEKFLTFSHIQKVVLVISPSDEYYANISQINDDKLIVIDGGKERADSVHNALRYLLDNGLPDDTPVMVHDAARPCITHDDLLQLLDSYEASNQACLLAAPVVDTIQQVDSDLNVEKTLDRSQMIRALTPQMARFIDLKDAVKSSLDEGNSVTDEVSALIASGHQVTAVMGRNDNIKITHPYDLALAEFYLEQQSLEQEEP